MTDLTKAAREALIAWWEDHRPLGWTAEQHRAQPAVNAQSETDKPLMEIAAAASRAALSEAPGEEREGWVLVPVEPTWDMKMAASTAYREPIDGHYTARMACAENAYRAMLAARPEVPQSEPVAHLWQHSETGRTRVVMPDQIVTADASWRVVGPLYLTARTSAPTVALTDERRTSINDPRNAAALAAIRLRLQTDPDYARQTLESAGILTPDGSLAPEFGGKEGGA
jgi:hypothetical protein